MNSGTSTAVPAFPEESIALILYELYEISFANPVMIELVFDDATQSVHGPELPMENWVLE